MTDVVKMKIQLGSKGIVCIHDATGVLIGVLLKKPKNGELMPAQQIEIMRRFTDISVRRLIVESPQGHEQELNEFYNNSDYTFLYNRDVYNNIRSKGGNVIDVELLGARGIRL